MVDKFKAIVLNQSDEQFSREIKTLDKSFLGKGDVLIKIDYSNLNFKDAMILKNGGKLITEDTAAISIMMMGHIFPLLTH